ncbi:MAG: hypothetical protein ACI9GH_000249 [Candidatus Paceibacteria bacterium]|jgi:hypothetical protein
MHDIIRKILTLLVAITIVGLLFFGVYKLIGITGDKPSSILGKGDPITVSSDIDSTASGKNVKIGWVPNTEVSGFYSVTYTCNEAVKVSVKSGTISQELICEKPFNLGSESKNITLIPTLLKSDSYTDVEIVVSFTENGKRETSQSGSTIVTVTDDGTVEDDVPSVTVVETPDDKEVEKKEAVVSSDSLVAAPVAVRVTPADLVVSNITSLSDQSAFQMTVINKGGRSTGSWTFNYTTPTDTIKVFSSPFQPSLAPGQFIILKVSYNEQSNDANSIAVTLNPTRKVYESNYGNNTIHVIIKEDNNNYDHDEADLVIQDIEIGRINNNGNFVEDDTIDEDDDVAVRFEVENEGEDDDTMWRFEIDLPGTSDDFRSIRQYGLDEGERITFTVNLGELDEDDYELEVTIDSEDDIDESNERNNDESIDFEVEG